MNATRRKPPHRGGPLFASAWVALFCVLRGMLVRQA